MYYEYLYIYIYIYIWCCRFAHHFGRCGRVRRNSCPYARLMLWLFPCTSDRFQRGLFYRSRLHRNQLRDAWLTVGTLDRNHLSCNRYGAEHWALNVEDKAQRVSLNNGHDTVLRGQCDRCVIPNVKGLPHWWLHANIHTQRFVPLSVCAPLNIWVIYTQAYSYHNKQVPHLKVMLIRRHRPVLL